MGNLNSQRSHAAVAIFFLISVVLGGCTGATRSSTSPSPNPSPSPSPTPTPSPTPSPSPGTGGLAVTPGTVSVRLASRQQFSATLNGAATSAVKWSVNGVAGGNATFGTIDANGLYSTPNLMPSSNALTVTANSTSNSSASASSAMTLENPIPVLTSMSPTTIGLGNFTIEVSGGNFVDGDVIMFGNVPLVTTYVSSAELSAPGFATIWGTAPVTVQAPNPGASVSANSLTMTVVNGQAASPAAAVRMLEQSSFGPTTDTVNQVEQIGLVPYLNNQFASPASRFPDPGASTSDLSPDQKAFFVNALTRQDQLRQRVAFALSEILVTSGNTIAPQGMATYGNMLSADAFTNYRTIIQDVTLSPAMGTYLNMVNNDKPDLTANTHANENYARELMQLFTLGLYQLNPDGTLQLDSSNNPIPSYDQNAVQGMARALTGWTYAPFPGHGVQTHDPVFWVAAMVAVDSNHDVAAKTLFSGLTLPAGQSAQQDLNGALDNLFSNPNLGPFVSQQLIQHLVTSNPSPAYVSRVTSAFNSGTFMNFGSGQRGDMKAVIAAILLDSEARRGDNPATAVATDGHLREPILYISNLLRAFGGISDGGAPLNAAYSLNEAPLNAPSVFNFFPPGYVIPGTNLLGPEFELQTTATAMNKINFVNSFVYWGMGSGTSVNFQPYANLAATDVNQMVEALNTLMLHGSLSAPSKAAILAAVNTVPLGSNQHIEQAKMAIFLIASSSQYQVEY